MRSILPFFVMLLPLFGCVPDLDFKPKDAFNAVDPAFQPYVHAWQLNYKGDWPPGLEIKFGKPRDHKAHVGDCQATAYNGSAYQYTINIDPTDWDNMRLYQREATILHELGHCVALRDHIEGELTIQVEDNDFTCPASYMSKNIKSEETYAACRAELFKELFGYKAEQEIFWPNYKLNN